MKASFKNMEAQPLMRDDVSERISQVEDSGSKSEEIVEVQNFDELAKDFLSNRFTAHSFPNIASGRSHCRRVAWSCISLILVFCLAVLIIHLLTEYFRYPKQVNIEVILFISFI